MASSAGGRGGDGGRDSGGMEQGPGDRRPVIGRVWSPDLGEEVETELSFHLEMRIREYMERGMDEAAARQQAETGFGDLDRMRRRLRRLGARRDRSARWSARFGQLGQDGRHAVRQLRRTPGFALMAILTLALGIGSTTAIFSVLNAVVLRPLPFSAPDRLVDVREVWQERHGQVSAGNYVDLMELSQSFESLAAGHRLNLNLIEGDAPERVIGGAVTYQWFQVFGTQPLLGRTFTESEDVPGADNVVVLSHALWQSHYAGDRSVIGRTVRIGDRVRTVIGVMPTDFDPLQLGDALWLPAAFTPERRQLHDEHYLDVIGRLRPGISIAAANTDVEAAGALLAERFPQDNLGRTFSVTPLTQTITGAVRVRLFVLMGAVALVLLIACGNVANLLLARGAARGRELAVRGALGAGRGRIMAQLMTESGVLALAAAVVGSGLAWIGIRLFVSYAPAGIPRLANASLDAGAMAFALLAAAGSTLLAGVVPAARATRADTTAVLKDGPRGAAESAPRDRLRTALIAAEVALALTLLVGAGLLIRSAILMQRVDPGFDMAGLMTGRVTFPPAAYRDTEPTRQAFMRIANELNAVSGVSAAVVSQAPLGPGGNSNGLVPEGRPMFVESAIDSRLRVITPRYFQTMGIQLVAGREFDTSDVASSRLVMIVSQELARIAWPGEDPIGKRIACCEGSEDDPRWKTVIGIAADVRSNGPASDPRAEFYLPITQVPAEAFDWINRTMTLIARSDRGDAASLVPVMRTVVRSVDPSVPLHSISTMDGALRRITAQSRFNTRLLAALGIAGMLLAVGGIYGVVAYFVGLRRYEIGVRMALGASAGGVVRLMMRQGAVSVGIGIAIGTLASLAATRALRSYLFGIEPSDPVTYVAAAALMLVVGTSAAFLPARRAARIQPTQALNSS